MQKLPITGVTLTADRPVGTGQTYPTYPYGETATLTATVNHTETDTLKLTFYVDGKNNGNSSFTSNNPATDSCSWSDLPLGKHTIYVEAKKGGYTAKSNSVTINITRGTLSTDDIDAPTANNRSYDDKEHPLVEIPDLSDGTYYLKVGENGEWGTSAKATDAGTYNVYWYIGNCENYEDLGSQENPAGTITVTVAKAMPTAADFTFTAPLA